MATQTISLSVRRGLKAPGLLHVLREECDKLHPLMPSMKRHHYRAEYVDNSFEVESVDHIEGDVYSMNFSYNWFAGSGCKDDVGGDIDFDCTRFTYRNGTIVFEYEEPEERYPDDEF